MSIFRFESLAGISGRIVLFAVSATLYATPVVRAGKSDDEKNLFMGIVVKVEDECVVAIPVGKEGPQRRIRITKQTQISFVGFKGIGKTAEKPCVGFALRSNLSKDDVARTILFTPDYPTLKSPLNRHMLSPEALYKAADLNQDGRVDYVEYATVVFQSYKHLPDRWRKKLDRNHDDVLDLKEFTESLESLEWWRLSRKSADEWVKEFDKNGNGQLEIEELKAIIGDAHGKIYLLFASLDKDKSNGLSAREFQTYVDKAIAGKN